MIPFEAQGSWLGIEGEEMKKKFSVFQQAKRNDWSIPINSIPRCSANAESWHKKERKGKIVSEKSNTPYWKKQIAHGYYTY